MRQDLHTYVRDKDGVDACLMIAEMYAYYKTYGSSLLDNLDKLYQMYGYRLNTLHSYKFDGEMGLRRMQEIMTGSSAELILLQTLRS